MARSYARIMTAIWRDDDFLALSVNAQRTYMLLVSQPDISAAGTLPLRVRRWAAMAADTTTQTLGDGLRELIAAGFIAVDRATEELLVRSFIRWDGGGRNPKRRPVIHEAAHDVDSVELRSMLASELEKVGIASDSLSDSHADTAPDSGVEVVTDGANALQAEVPESFEFSQENSLSDSPSGTVSPFERRVPQPATRNPQPVPASPGAQGLVGEWIETCRKRPPKNVIGQMSKHVKSLLEEGVDPDDIRNGIELWSSKGLHPSTLPSVVNEAMNQQPRASPAMHQTDANIAQMLGNQPNLRAIPGGES